MSIPFYPNYELLGVLLLLLFHFCLLLMLVSRLQDILQAIKSKLKGDLTKMNNNKLKDENVEIDEFLNGYNKAKKSEDKPRAIGRLAGSMLFVVFGLAAMMFITVMNQSFDGLTDIHTFTMSVLSLVMITCCILIFFVVYLENEAELEQKNNTRLRNIIDSANDLTYAELLNEIRGINRHSDEVDIFLKAQYGKLYDLVE